MKKFLISKWNTWKRVTRPIAEFQAQLIFALVYLLFIWPLGIIFSLFIDALEIKKKTIARKKSMFVPWNYTDETINDMRKPF